MRPIHHAAIATYIRMVDEYAKLVTSESIPEPQIRFIRDGLYRLVADLSPPQESDKLLPATRKEPHV